MIDQSTFGSRVKFIAGLLAGSLFALPVHAQSNQAEQAPSAPPVVAKGTAAKGVVAKDAAAKNTPATAATARKVSPYRQERVTNKAKKLYASTWGVDRLKVSHTASGNLIRFSYRVSDPERAKVLGDKKATPYLLGQKSRAVLQIPVMDKVGQLRQTGAPIAGQEYWMVFSNKGNLIKPGDRVNVVIGSFHADGLMVE
jgi:hypothetical protein